MANVRTVAFWKCFRRVQKISSKFWRGMVFQFHWPKLIVYDTNVMFNHCLSTADDVTVQLMRVLRTWNVVDLTTKITKMIWAAFHCFWSWLWRIHHFSIGPTNILAMTNSNSGFGMKSVQNGTRKVLKHLKLLFEWFSVRCIMWKILSLSLCLDQGYSADPNFHCRFAERMLYRISKWVDDYSK